MNSQIPLHLESTVRLIDRAYPEGVPPDDYFPLITVLAKHLSEENSAIIAARFASERKSVLNDVLRAKAYPSNTEHVQRRLNAAGFAEWHREDG